MQGGGNDAMATVVSDPITSSTSRALILIEAELTARLDGRADGSTKADVSSTTLNYFWVHGLAISISTRF